MMKKPLMRIVVIGGLLIVSNSYACPPPNQYPTAHLTITPESVLTGQTVTLDANDSYDPDGYITLYEWDFDYNGVNFNRDYWESDGNAPDGNFDGVTTYEYSSGGDYIVILRVTDNGSKTDTDTGSIHVIQTYYVDPNGSDDNNGLSWATAFKTIQHGINVAQDYNIVKVNEGTYRENINFNGITCTITSTDPNDWEFTANTIVEANDANLDVIVLEGVDSVIKGFTITDGNGGIYCDGNSPTISNCVIRGNTCNGDGGGMWISNSFPLISDCFFVENDANNGGAVYEVNSSSKFTNCVFSKNTADANGGAMYNENSCTFLINCAINRNDANDSEGYGGAIYDQNSAASLVNCIVWDNNAWHIEQIFNDNNSLDPNDPNFVSWWKLDETNGTVANDSVGDNDGTLANGPVWTNGIIYGGLDFDGINDYIEVPDDNSLRFTQYDSFSICAWVKPVSTGEILCKMQSSGQYGLFTYEMQWNAVSQQFNFVICKSGVSYVVITTPSGSAPAGSWYQVTCIYENRNMKIYLNGKLSASGYFPYDTGNNTADKNLAMGARLVGYGIESYFKGTLDDVRIYNRALDLGEIHSLASFVRYSDIEGCGGSGDGWDPNLGIDGGGNIDADPCFVNSNDPNGNDDIFGTIDDGLRPNSESSCIDAADGDFAPSTDILDFERADINDVNNTGTGDPDYSDIGAYEFNTAIHNLTKDLYYSTIQEAIDGASHGDTIEVLKGTYKENIDFHGKIITLKGTDPNDPCVVAETIIDANNSSVNVVVFETESSNTILEGFTIKGTTTASGIRCEGSASPKISKCIIRNNKWGIYCVKSSFPTVTRCVIKNNTVHGFYSVTDKAFTVSGCRILNNTQSGIDVGYDVGITDQGTEISNCVVARNGTYGINAAHYQNGVIRNCTVFGNKYGMRKPYGTGVGVLEAKNCIVWGNTTDNLFSYDNSITYSCIQDNDSGQGNIHIYPLFVNSDNNDFHLQPGSFCIDAGDPTSAWSNEPNGGGGRVDMGAYGNTDEATVIVDDDEDSIDDNWERQYFHGDDPNLHDPNEDPDGDSLRNIDEYRIGWNPDSNDSDSIKGIVHIDRSNSSYQDINCPSISMATIFAFEGDNLILAPDTNYYENEIRLWGKPIHLRSVDPNDPNVVASTVVNGNDTDKDVIILDRNEGADTIIDGLTIKGGQYGINCASSPIIVNCVIKNNQCGIYINPSGDLTVTHCTISENGTTAGSGNGGIFYSGSGNLVVTYCTISGNKGLNANQGGIYWNSSTGTLTVENCIVKNNQYCGINAPSSPTHGDVRIIIAL